MGGEPMHRWLPMFSARRRRVIPGSHTASERAPTTAEPTNLGAHNADRACSDLLDRRHTCPSALQPGKCEISHAGALRIWSSGGVFHAGTSLLGSDVPWTRTQRERPG